MEKELAALLAARDVAVAEVERVTRAWEVAVRKRNAIVQELHALRVRRQEGRPRSLKGV